VPQVVARAVDGLERHMPVGVVGQARHESELPVLGRCYISVDTDVDAGMPDVFGRIVVRLEPVVGAGFLRVSVLMKVR
jgi:hypothetical protein